MTSLDELKRTLEEQARSAPDGANLLDAIVRTADRHRRRRTATGAVLAIVVGVALLVAVPVESRWLSRRAPAPASNPSATPSAVHYRDPAQITVDLQANPKWAVRAYALDATTQYVLVREPDGAELSGFGVVVHNPGTFSPTQLRNATPARVQGHAAQKVEDLSITTVFDALGGYRQFSGPAIVWQDDAGAWVVVYGLPFAPTDLAAFAELVRVGAPRAIAVTSPISFGYIPSGLGLMYGTASAADLSVDLGFGDHQIPNPAVAHSLGSGVYPMLVQVGPRDSYTDFHDGLLGQPTIVNGVATWSSADMEQVLIPPGGRVLIAQTASCHVFITVLDANRVSLADLQQMIAGAHFDNCNDAKTWGSIHG